MAGLMSQKVNMRKVRSFPISRLIGLATLSVILVGSLFSQAIPVVEKVDPPTWQPNSSSDVMLRISGQGMDAVVGVKTKHKGVRVMRVESPDQNHLLVWLKVSSGAAPGTMMLQVSTRYMTTFTAVPSFGESSAPPLTAGK